MGALQLLERQLVEKYNIEPVVTLKNIPIDKVVYCICQGGNCDCVSRCACNTQRRF